MILRKKTYIFTFFIILLCGVGILHVGFTPSLEGGIGSVKLYPVKSLQEDLSVLRSALEEGHGALYRYSTKVEVDQRFDAVFSQLNREMTEREFLKILAPLVASVNCGHTRWRPSTAFSGQLNRRPVFLPFRFKFIEGKAYLLYDLSDMDDFALGGEVLAINGHPMQKILEVFLNAISSDAHIETSKFRYLESTQRFCLLLDIFFGAAETYKIDYRSPGSEKVVTLTVPGYPASEINSRFRERHPELNQALPPISFEYKEEIPVLTIRTFAGGPYGRAKISFPEFLKETFQGLNDKEEKALIIDMRNNGGGSDAFGKILFAHLIDKPFHYYEALEVKKLMFDFFKYTNIPENRKLFSEKFFKPNDRGRFDFTTHPNVGLQEPVDPLYNGRVYALINGGSFSATGETTSLMHYHKKAVFVGEECGAGYYGNTSGSMPTLTLPHTRISVGIPLFRYSMAVGTYPPDRGIVPEYPIEPKIEDLLNNRDTVLNYTIDLIKRGRISR